MSWGSSGPMGLTRLKRGGIGGMVRVSIGSISRAVVQRLELMLLIRYVQTQKLVSPLLLAPFSFPVVFFSFFKKPVYARAQKKKKKKKKKL